MLLSPPLGLPESEVFSFLDTLDDDPTDWLFTQDPAWLDDLNEFLEP
jgi:hypothetical protein